RRRGRRRPGADRPAALAALPAESALLVSSREAFDGLWSRLEPAGREALRQRPAVASSPRLAARLAELGFQRLVVAAGATPSQMLDALAADVGAGRFREDDAASLIAPRAMNSVLAEPA